MTRGHRFWRRILVVDTLRKRPRGVWVRFGGDGFLLLVGEKIAQKQSTDRPRLFSSPTGKRNPSRLDPHPLIKIREKFLSPHA